MKKYCQLLLILHFPVYLTAQTQKLPNKQESSIWAPKNIKVDGRNLEWANQFEAHNSATDVYYTIANDNESLFIVVQARDPLIINKLYRRGLIFTLNASDKKNDKNGISVTFPVWDKENNFHTNTGLKPQIVQADPHSLSMADSFMRAVNKQMISKEKWIRIGGIVGLDTLISVYNQDGIKAAALFDNQMIYTLELGIALKYIIPAQGSITKLSYHLQINALNEAMDNEIRTQNIGPDGRMVYHITLTTHLVIGSASDEARLNNLHSKTDFWGEYILAKKP